MNQNKILFTLFIVISISLIVLILGCSANQIKDNDDCTKLKKILMITPKKSSLPIHENPQSLCYGLSMASDFSNLPPKWAVGRLTEVEKNTDYRLTFDGIETTGTLLMPLPDKVASSLKVGNYYKLDMNNICRYFFLMADSRYPSPITETFVSPKEISCN